MTPENNYIRVGGVEAMALLPSGVTKVWMGEAGEMADWASGDFVTA